MHDRLGVILLSLSLLLVIALAPGISQQSQTAGVLSATEVKQVVPATYFFRGQSASVQIRNSAGIRQGDGTLLLAGLVDTGGYATDVREKYQGLLITEFKVEIGGKSLQAGAYGFGFVGEHKFLVLDVGSHDVLQAEWQEDAGLQHARPLQIVEKDGVYRLYAGKKFVVVKTQ